MSSTITALTSGGGLAMAGDTSGQLELKTNNGTTAMTIDTSQNVGVGTTSPSSYYKTNFVVNSASSTGISIIDTSTTLSMIAFGYGNNATLGASSNRGKFWYDLSNDSFNWNTAGTGSLTPQMRIDSSGNALFGTTNPSGSAGNGVKITNGNSVYVVNNGANDGYDYYNTAASAFRFYVNAAGTISATNGSINVISDQRFKENIVDLDAGLDKILELKPRKFDWKEGKGKDIKGDRGFIAQEFETVFPDLIGEWKDPAPEGEEPYKSVRADLIPVLVKAIQELNAKVEAQALEIKALKGVA